jgi:hypothetical protein
VGLKACCYKGGRLRKVDNNSRIKIKMEKAKKFKIILKVFLGLILIYSICFKVFTSLFDFFNKNRDMGFWTSFIESDLPNFISIMSMCYLTWLVFKRPKETDT